MLFGTTLPAVGFATGSAPSYATPWPREPLPRRPTAAVGRRRPARGRGRSGPGARRGLGTRLRSCHARLTPRRRAARGRPGDLSGIRTRRAPGTAGSRRGTGDRAVAKRRVSRADDGSSPASRNSGPMRSPPPRSRHGCGRRCTTPRGMQSSEPSPGTWNKRSLRPGPTAWELTHDHLSCRRWILRRGSAGHSRH